VGFQNEFCGCRVDWLSVRVVAVSLVLAAPGFLVVEVLIRVIEVKDPSRVQMKIGSYRLTE
jgi:hypothetical protein